MPVKQKCKGETMKKALLVIDIQNDYFPGGKFPLWNTDVTLSSILEAINAAKSKNIPIILIQHIANTDNGISPFFNKDSEGVKVHPQILEAAPDAPIVNKGHADSFEKTTLEMVLQGLGVDELLVCGMMTQNCVTHTAISKAAEKYKVSILPDCCTTVDAMIHNIALNAVSTRVALVPSKESI
jgi:nicotinamidase-related amidase